MAGIITATAQALEPEMKAFVDVEMALIGCHGATAAKPIQLHGYNATPVIDPVAL
jgi:hypothetical protein